MPLAAVRAKELAFLISISGAGVPPAETTIDQTRNEMTGRGMKPQTVDDIVAIMKLQYQFARTRQGWDEYAAAREKLAGRIGRPPDTPVAAAVRAGVLHHHQGLAGETDSKVRTVRDGPPEPL